MDQRILAQLNLADKARISADYWRARAQYWANQVEQWHDVVLFCREQRHKLAQLRRKRHGENSVRKS